MRRVTLRRSGLSVSRLGFGTSRLHYLSRRDAERLVRTALDCGITHIDTAPLYGDGFAEQVVGAALSGGRSAVTVATKFGLLPSRLIGAAGPAATPLRGARSMLRRLGILPPARHSWAMATLEGSLAASLTALRRDSVDILFLHEPRAEDLDRGDELMAALRRHKEAGWIGAIGVAGHLADAEQLLARYGAVIDVVQVPETDWQDGGIVPEITYGALASGPQMLGARKPAADVVRSAFARALARRPDGCLLVGTTNDGHLRQLAEIASGEAGR